MRHFKPRLDGKGLLAASIALLSGPALAEVAGRVSFVSGDALVQGADGNGRALQRGDAINGGDRITTRAGRVQIRFTDGGFVSLQPNSVFGVDEYLYANRKPEESSLFFSLLQGGMRTITGAIGKVNRKSYQVRTPVATIGIRGTEYRAIVDEGGLVVSVGRGLVNVSNPRGDVTGGAGQNIRVRGPGDAPALGRDEAQVLASGVDGDAGTTVDDDQEDDDTVAVADVQNARGDYLLLFTTPGVLPDSVPPKGPVYQLGSPRLLASPDNLYFGDFDQDGSVTGSVGGLVRLYGYGDTTSGFVSAFESGSLRVVNSGTKGALTWGEFTNGISGANDVLSSCASFCPGTFELGTGQYLPYIAGLEPLGNLGKGTAVYTLQGATPVRNATGAAGRLENFVIKLDLDFATLQALLRVSVPVVSESPGLPAPPPKIYTVTTNNPVPLLDLGTAASFKLDSSLLTVADNQGACAASAGVCSATIAGFFAGSLSQQIGASYQITDWWSGNDLSGVAALGVSAHSSTTLSDGAGYTLALAHNSTANLGANAATLGGYVYYDQTTNPITLVDNSLTLQFSADGNLQTAHNPDSSTALDRQNAQAADLGQAGALKWGRWYTDGTSADIIINGSTQTLSPNQSLHHIAGPMTQPNFFAGINNLYPNGATATYSYQGGTTATGNDGSTGRLASGSFLAMHFGFNPSLTMDLQLDMDTGNDYHITGSTTPVMDGGGARFMASSSMSCSAGGSAGSCIATVSGFFAGQQAQQIGMSYLVQDFAGHDVSGAAAFGRGKITAVTPPPVLIE